jgi:soluble lytic murein transglycosylase-like protein
MKVKKIDAIAGIAIALTAIIALTVPVKGEEPLKGVQKPYGITATAEANVPKAEYVLEEQPVTELTVALYDVPLDEDIQLYIIGLCEEKHIDPAVVVAMIGRESNYDEFALGDGGNSYGLMQVQPRWHYDRMVRLDCMNLYSPYQNIAVGVDFLAELLDRYDGDIAKALTAYNQGSYKGTVSKYAKGIIEVAEELRGEAA